jgi:hypothetical protein
MIHKRKKELCYLNLGEILKYNLGIKIKLKKLIRECQKELKSKEKLRFKMERPKKMEVDF